MGTRSHTSTKKILKSKLFLFFGVRTRNSQFIERRDFLVSFLFSFEFLQQSSVSAAGSDGFFLDWLTSTRSALHKSAFTLVFYDMGARGQTGHMIIFVDLEESFNNLQTSYTSFLLSTYLSKRTLTTRWPAFRLKPCSYQAFLSLDLNVNNNNNSEIQKLFHCLHHS